MKAKGLRAGISLSDLLLDIKLRAYACGLHPLSLVLQPSFFRRRRGQTTVEYLLMLAVVAGMAAMMAVMFHKRIMGGIFTMIGLIIGAGTPK